MRYNTMAKSTNTTQKTKDWATRTSQKTGKQFVLWNQDL
jgi:hypothetical protein